MLPGDLSCAPALLQSNCYLKQYSGLHLAWVSPDGPDRCNRGYIWWCGWSQGNGPVLYYLLLREHQLCKGDTFGTHLSKQLKTTTQHSTLSFHAVDSVLVLQGPHQVSWVNHPRSISPFLSTPCQTLLNSCLLCLAFKSQTCCKLL